MLHEESVYIFHMLYKHKNNDVSEHKYFLFMKRKLLIKLFWDCIKSNNDKNKGKYIERSEMVLNARQVYKLLPKTSISYY